MLINNFSDVIYDAFWSGIFIALLNPAFIAIICGLITIKIIKSLLGNLIYAFAIVSGDTHRSAKRKAKISQDIIDLASTTNDVNSHI